MSLISALFGNASEKDPIQLHEKYAKLLCADEKIELGFQIIKDTFLFTNKRLILIAKENLVGKKIEYLTISYKSISRFSIQTAGIFDLDAELRIWVSSEQEPSIVKKFNSSVDVYEVQKVLAHFVL